MCSVPPDRHDVCGRPVVLSRSPSPASVASCIYQFGDCILDTARRELRQGDASSPVEPQVFDVLEFLIEARDRVVSRDDLLDAVWHGRIVSEATLSSRVNSARTAIGDNGAEQRLIRTVPRKGVRFVGAGAGGPASRAGRIAAPRPVARSRLPSVAVLPFTNMSGDPEQDYFADGMAEEIITALSRSSGLFVIARNSSFTYKGKAVDVRQVGRELGVGYVLEGSVRRSGDRLRITGQLVDAASGAHLWADRFEGDPPTSSSCRTGLPRASSRRSSRHCSSPRSSGAGETGRPARRLRPLLRAYALLARLHRREPGGGTGLPRPVVGGRSRPTPRRWRRRRTAARSAISRAGRRRTRPAARRRCGSPGGPSSSRRTTRRCSGWPPSRVWNMAQDGARPGAGAVQPLPADQPELGHGADARGLDRDDVRQPGRGPRRWSRARSGSIRAIRAAGSCPASWRSRR